MGGEGWTALVSFSSMLCEFFWLSQFRMASSLPEGTAQPGFIFHFLFLGLAT